MLYDLGNPDIIKAAAGFFLHLSFRKGAEYMSSRETFLMKPKVDFCFKELMEDEEVRRGFISAVLGVSPENIIQTELLPTHLRVEYKEDKLGILDVRVRLNGDTQMDMEIQIAPFELWAERSLFYLSKMYTEQIHSGEEYAVLQKCIHVGILDFTLFEEDEEYYSRFHLWEDSRRRMYTDKLEVHILELPKLSEFEYPKTELLNWARFLAAEHKEEFEMLANEDSYIGKAYERLTNISANEEKRLEYEAREKAIRDYNHQMKSNWKAGHEAGLEQGIQQGFLSGVELTRKALKLFAKGKSVQEIAKELNISEEQIQKMIE